jgi:hypothetical protein
MRYFTYLAEQAFVTNEQGQRLFFLDGPFLRPYLIDDPAIESRLFWKLTWFNRIAWIPLFVVLPFLMSFFIPFHSWLFVSCAIGLLGIHWIALHGLFNADLRALPREENRTSLHSYYLSWAGRHSEGYLWLGLLTCVVYAVGSFVLCLWIGWFPIFIFSFLIFTLAAAGWGYALTLKKEAKPLGTSLARERDSVVGPANRHPEI